MAEREGFEPSKTCALLHFECSALDQLCDLSVNTVIFYHRTDCLYLAITTYLCYFVRMSSMEAMNEQLNVAKQNYVEGSAAAMAGSELAENVSIRLGSLIGQLNQLGQLLPRPDYVAGKPELQEVAGALSQSAESYGTANTILDSTVEDTENNHLLNAQRQGARAATVIERGTAETIELAERLHAIGDQYAVLHELVRKAQGMAHNLGVEVGSTAFSADGMDNPSYAGSAVAQISAYQEKKGLPQ